MKYKFLFQFFIISCFFIGNTLTAQKFTFETIPQWVVEIDTIIDTKVSKYDIKSGYYVSIADYQVNLFDDSYYSHEVINVVSFSGITNASQLAITYDTSYQELIIHHLYIWRNGKKIDRTMDLSLENLNVEQVLHMGIYTGQITAYDILEDIRKDDRIDFAYTLVGNNPIFNDEKYMIMPMGSINPIDYYSLRVIYSKDKDYIYDCVGCEDDFLTDTITDNYHLLEIAFYNLQAIEFEELMPSWILPYNYFILSSIPSWQGVYEWAEGVFALENEPNLDEVFDEIFSGDELMDDKINKIINYVQDDIRYMGIESGIGSIKPFPPEQVVKQRFGDCKDKSLLMVSLLKKIGVEKSFPALVNVIMQQKVSNLLPGAEIFNHCIVYFEHDSASYWIDPTITQQGGNYKNIFSNNFGKALIIGRPADSLHDMVFDSVFLGINITEEFTVNSFNEPVELKIESKRYGMDADYRRALLEYYSLKDISDLSTKELSIQFPKVEAIKDIEIHDDIDSNVFTAVYHYEIDDFWLDGDKQNGQSVMGMRFFRFEPTTIYNYLQVLSTCKSRTYPITLNYPLSLNYTVIFHFPDKILVDDDVDEYENEAFYFREKIEQLNARTIQIDYTVKTLTKEISPEIFPDICKQMKEVMDELPIAIYFFK